MDDAAEKRVLITFVLCSRNDQFQGDSLWRLGITLNYLARQLAALGRLDAAEVIVSDWGSTAPLRDALPLTDEARQLVRFLTVPPDLAKEKQQDSPFAEVIAINAAARRARGDYVGRIDQDTLVGKRFLRWFFEAAEHGRPQIESKIMISNRRRIPYHFAVRTPRLPVVERYVELFGPRLPRMEAAPPGRFWEVYVGIILFHRKLWDDVEGYDESFLYYGAMEWDLFLRVMMKYEGLDIGPLVGDDFYHLDHVPSWIVARNLTRKTNPMRRPGENEPPAMRPNGPDWGLQDQQLPLEPCGAVRQLATATRWQPGDGSALRRLTATSTLLTLLQMGHDYGRREALRLWRRRRRATA